MIHVETHSYPSYSQAGEDRLLFYLFQSLGCVERLSYLDVGAAAPVGHNNTFLFYVLGGQGVLVEADPAYMEAYGRVRPRDLVENVAIVPNRLRGKNSISFHLMQSPGWSTVSPEHAGIAQQLGKGGLRQTITAPCCTINEVLARHFVNRKLDILSLDIEGVDAEVLAELDLSRFRPRAIVAENPFDASGSPAMTGVTADRLRDAGYRPFGWTFVNYIFVEENELARFVI